MDSLKNNKNTLGFILIIAALFFGYKFFISSSEKAPIETISAGQEILNLNSSLQNVTLDTALLSSETYRSLVDFTVPLQSQPVGKSNPFSSGTTLSGATTR